MFPLAALLPIIERLRSCVMAVMRPLGDRTRRAPSMWTPAGKLIPEPLVVLIQAWLRKRRQMIEALIHRIAEGKHIGRAPKPREIRPDSVTRPRPEIPPEKQLPPRVFGWINGMASEVNQHAAGLTDIVGTPEMRAMIEASPQMARLWVPLLNSLGQRRPEWWPKPPPRPRRRRPRRPRAPKPPGIWGRTSVALDPVAAWLARIPPPPPPPPLPPGMALSAPSILARPLPWFEDSLWPPDHPIWKRHSAAAPPASPAAFAAERPWNRQESQTERWVQVSTRWPSGE